MTKSEMFITGIRIQNVKTQEVQEFRVHKARIIFGASDSADVRLHDSSINGMHAILEASGPEGRPVLYDLASDQGVLVNGKKILQANISQTDVIEIGSFKITFIDEHHASPMAPDAIEAEVRPLLLQSDRDVIEIFDYPPSHSKALQVVMLYGGSILDVEHFSESRSVVIGPNRGDDFGVPPFFGQGKISDFTLVTRDGGKAVLHLEEHFGGVVSCAGQMTSVDQLVKNGNAKQLVLGERDFAKIKIGDVGFFINFTAAPPRLKPRKLTERDPLFLKIWMASLLFTAAVLIGISTIHVEAPIEIEQLPERVATIIFEPKNLPRQFEKARVEEEVAPPKVQPPEPPKVVQVKPKQNTESKSKEIVLNAGKTQKQGKMAPQSQKPKAAPGKPAQQASGQEGAGARAKGDEGSRGAHNKPKAAVPQTKALRPGEGKPTNRASTGKGQSETNGLGVVDVFRSNQGTLSKLFAGGKGVANAVSQLEGYSGFTSQGEGGLGAAGSGKGGGGQSMGLGGLADKGIGGGKRGTGLGALGHGGNLLGGSGKLMVDSGGGGGGDPVVMGAIDTDAIAREIAKHRDEIKYCYEKEINKDRPDLAGKVNIRFVIGPSGGVTAAGVASTTLHNVVTEGCVVNVIKRIQFPPIRGGGVAEVTYPFVFKPSNK